MRFVQLRWRDGREQVRANDVDLRRSFDAVRGVAVSRDVERLIRILRVVEVIRDGKLVSVSQVEVNLAKKSLIIDLV